MQEQQTLEAPAPREIPEGKILLCEYSDVNDSNRAQLEVLEERHVPSKRRTYRLVRCSAGFTTAGSVARWTNGYYAVWFELQGARHGQQFKTLEEARERFELWAADPS